MQMDWGGRKRGVRETREGREERDPLCRRERTEANERNILLSFPRPKRKRFITVNTNKESLNEPNGTNERVVSRVSRDWRLMKRAKADTHHRDFEWQDTALEFSLPLQLPQTFISALLETRGKKYPSKRTRGKEVEWQLPQNFSPRRGRRATAPPVLRTLCLSWQATTVLKALFPNLSYLASELNDAFNVTRVKDRKIRPPVKVKQLQTHNWYPIGSQHK